MTGAAIIIIYGWKLKRSYKDSTIVLMRQFTNLALWVKCVSDMCIRYFAAPCISYINNMQKCIFRPAIALYKGR
jgi:hypothetical protein